MKKIKANLIYNPTSGQVWNTFKPELVKKYLESKGWKLDISKTECQGDGIRLAKDSLMKKYDVVVVAGGDGTINEVVQGLAGSNISLGILPVGTTNVMARDLKIPLNFQEALRVLVEGETIDIDLGIINKKYFVMMAGIGFDAKLVNEVDSNLKKFTGPVAFVATSPVSMVSHKQARMSIILWDKNGKKKKIKRDSYQVLISNAPTYAISLQVSLDAKFDDGLLDVDIFKSQRLHEFAWKLISIAFISKKSDSNMTETFQCKKMTIKTDPPMPIQVDGDSYGMTPALIEVKANYLKIIKPKD